jgi:hypothetical protein
MIQKDNNTIDFEQLHDDEILSSDDDLVALE